jgi:hypothetical protein
VVLQLFGKSSFLVGGLVIFFRWFAQEMGADRETAQLPAGEA